MFSVNGLVLLTKKKIQFRKKVQKHNRVDGSPHN